MIIMIMIMKYSNSNNDNIMWIENEMTMKIMKYY